MGLGSQVLSISLDLSFPLNPLSLWTIVSGCVGEGYRDASVDPRIFRGPCIIVSVSMFLEDPVGPLVAINLLRWWTRRFV